jgi:hypothetical protein
MHVAPNIEDVQPKPGNWDKMLVQIWPVGRHNVMWPAELTFTRTGPRSIATLMDRWRMGQEVGRFQRQTGIVLPSADQPTR